MKRYLNCREHIITASRRLGYQSMLKQWMSERLESELRERGNK